MPVATGHYLVYITVLLGIAIAQLQPNNAPDDMYPCSHDGLHPIKIHERGGREVELKCTGKRQQGVKRHRVVWHYIHCGNAHGVTPCKDYVDDKDLSKWTILNFKTFNQTTVKLQKATEKDNGLYRCSIRNTAHPKILTTYELDIVDKAETKPEIIQGPENQTVEVGTRATFQCLVLSKIEPTIKWFRKQDLANNELKRNTQPGNTNEKRFLPWSNGTYELLISHMVKRPQDKYLSKLILPETTEWDTGCYICFAVNNIDFVHKDAYLSVISTHKLSDEEDISSLSWLFLIPVTLAIIPLSVWLCCLWRRRKRSATNSVDQANQQQPVNPRVKYKQVQSNLQTVANKTVRNGECV